MPYDDADKPTKGKGLALLLLKGKKPMMEEEGGMSDEGMYSEDLEMVMEDFISALKSGDTAAAAEAFKAGHRICSGYSGDDGMEE